MNELREARHLLGLTIPQMAAELRVSEVTLSRWERGIIEPPYTAILAVKWLLVHGLSDEGESLS